MFSRLHRAFWRYCELVGRCEADERPADEPADGVTAGLPDPTDAYIADGIRELERFIARRGRRRPQRR
jgi:hypothetical protein